MTLVAQSSATRSFDTLTSLFFLCEIRSAKYLIIHSPEPFFPLPHRLLNRKTVLISESFGIGFLRNPQQSPAIMMRRDLSMLCRSIVYR